MESKNQNLTENNHPQNAADKQMPTANHTAAAVGSGQPEDGLPQAALDELIASLHDAQDKKEGRPRTSKWQPFPGSGKKDADDAPFLVTPDPDCFSELEDLPDERADTGEETLLHTPAAPLYTEEELPYDPDDDDEDIDDEEDAYALSLEASLQRRRRKHRTRLVLLISLCTVILALLIVGVIFATRYKPSVDPFVPFDTGDDTDAPGTETSFRDDTDTSDDTSGRDTEETENIKPEIPIDLDYARRDNVYNFLILGVDRAANLSDVIMLVSYSVGEKVLHVVSLPRDTYIDVGSNYHTVNAYFAASYNHSAKRDEARYKDAISSMKTFLEKGLSVKLDRYICMDTAGFRDIVDAVGGVTMEVPFDMEYDDPEQDLYIHLKAGRQVLDGDKAEQFVRFRKAYLNGDIGRISAQRLFLTALAKQVKENLNFSTVAALAKTAISYVTTDLTAAECAYFAKEALTLDLENITFTTVPGAAAVNPDTGSGYYVMFGEVMRQIVNEQLNVYERTISSEVFLNNSRYFTSSADYISDVFLATGYSADTTTAKSVDEDPVDIPHRRTSSSK